MRALLAVDVRDRGHVVLDAAREWIERVGAVVDLVFVHEFTSPDAFFTDPALREMVARGWDDVLQQHRDTLSGWLATVPEAHRGRAIVLEGNPTSVLPDVAQDYDLLIVGTHGRTGIGRLWMGSVAEAVVRRTTIPTLVLHIGKT